MLKKLLEQLNASQDCPDAELASDGQDWSPIPIAATAREADTIDWLTAEVLTVEGDAAPPLWQQGDAPQMPAPRQKRGYLSTFSPEELAIIEQQKNAEQMGPAPGRDAHDDPMAQSSPAGRIPEHLMALLSIEEQAVVRQQQGPGRLRRFSKAG